ncbi:MAG: sigma-54-dependent Fis family transcriptional regulator, partial [Myxococcales bacterium]|nr:sigma-54-dependent Fis family transcriptional regulator [Myxococcales bacterium]
ATNRNLEEMVEDNRFRADLYDRINVIPLVLPPLRARRGDIALLARHFLTIAATVNDRPEMTITDAAIDALSGYSFPGNVRELRNIIERLVILSPDTTIDAEEVESAIGGGVAPATGSSYRPGVPFKVLVEEAEREILEAAIAHHDGQMAATARALGLERSHLYKKAKSLGLRET